MNSRLKPAGLPFRLFFDSSNDAMFVIPLMPDGKPAPFLDINAQACALTGYSRTELLTLSPVDLSESLDLDQWHGVVQELRKVGAITLEETFRTRQGNILHVELSVRHVDLDGAELALAIGRDITERVLAEYALRETERDLTAMINAHPESVLLATDNSTVIHANLSAAARFGMTPEEIRGQVLIDLSSAQSAPGRRKVMEQVRSTEQPVRFQDFRDGMHLDTTITPIDNTAGGARVAIFSRDISAQYVRVEVDNLLGEIDRRILKGGNLDNAAQHACERLAHAFRSPWVSLQSLTGTPFKSRHFGGVLGEAVDPGKVTDALNLTQAAEGLESPSFLTLEQLPEHLQQIFRSNNCEQLALVPMFLGQGESAVLLIALQSKTSFKGSDVLDLLDHVASRLRVAWGKTHELGKLSLLRQALEESSTAVVLATLRGTIVWCNRGIADAVATTQADLLGRRTREFLVDSESSSLKEMDRTLRAGHTWVGECDMRRSDGSVFTALQSVSPVFEEGETSPSHVIIIQEDITSEKQSQARIRYLAEHDPLTGLKNRATLISDLETLIADGRRSENELALLYLDIDHFKAINDTHGHGIGDKLLVAFADRLRQSVRHEDTVCRLGGDEFVIVARQIDTARTAAQVAQKLLDQARVPILCDGLELKVGTSIGVVMVSALIATRPDLEATDVLRAGDHAMYQAKKGGRNRYVFAAPDPGTA